MLAAPGAIARTVDSFAALRKAPNRQSIGRTKQLG
jgi:hypothetical protein